MLFAKKNDLEKIGQNLSEEESDFLAKATKILSEQVINTKDSFNKLQDEFNKELCEIENFDKLLSYNKLSTEEKEYLLKKSYGIINKMREKRNLLPINK
jgi:DNA integrity scanning protein DisA with diadenylate cyclase activity